MQIADFEIGSKPFIVAELSGNATASLDRARLLVDAAIQCQADAVKIQTFHPHEMPDKGDIVKGCGKWDGRYWEQAYYETALYWDDQVLLREYAKQKGIILFSTVCSVEAIDFWKENGGLPAYKIANWQATNQELIYHIPKGVPALISIKADIGTEHWAQALVSRPNTVYLAVDFLDQIPWLRMAKGLVGYSNHGLIENCVEAVKRGAAIIEQHFTLSRDSIDGQFAAMPDEFERMVKGVRCSFKAKL